MGKKEKKGLYGNRFFDRIKSWNKILKIRRWEIMKSTVTERTKNTNKNNNYKKYNNKNIKIGDEKTWKIYIKKYVQ